MQYLITMSVVTIQKLYEMNEKLNVEWPFCVLCGNKDVRMKTFEGLLFKKSRLPESSHVKLAEIIRYYEAAKESYDSVCCCKNWN